MCGIAGFVGDGNREHLQRMINALRHRGPDAQRLFINGQVGFAHTRLSIIDTSETGAQPMWSSDKSVAVVFNGEIYNFQELRKQLLATGKYHFVSRSDTEVILYAYQEYGEHCFHLFNGMFAIALYDFTRKRLLLARDRAGEKPLFYSMASGTFVFASEMKALLVHPSVHLRVNQTSLNKYLQFGYVPTPATMVEEVFKLEPATYLIYEAGKVNTIPFWRFQYSSDSSLSMEEAVIELDKKIRESVATRLIADVPLGVFLSGGLDSSTITYYARQLFPGQLKSFSIGFTERSFDESQYARLVAKWLGTAHYERIVQESELMPLVRKLTDFTDEPVADPSIIPTYILSKFAREQVTVVLGGDGGDELFAGYPTFFAEECAQLLCRFLPSMLLRVAQQVATLLPVRDSYLSLDFKVRKFFEGLAVPMLYRHPVWLGSFNVLDRKQLFHRAIWQRLKKVSVFEDIDRHAMEVKASFHNMLLHQYFRTYLMDRVLVKVDRASMANGLEVRAPFLDHHLMSFVNQLPYEYKHKVFMGKYILKTLMKGRLPDIVINRPKKGFAIPLARWLRGDLYPFAREVLSSRTICENGFFNNEYVQLLLKHHFEGKENNATKIWTLLVFQLWYDHWRNN